MYKRNDEEEKTHASWKYSHGSFIYEALEDALQHFMECKVLQQFEEYFPFSHLDLHRFNEEKIDDGGNLRMDNISHVCVGHFLSHAHHDGRFFPTTYLNPYGIKLILEMIAFQSSMKCRDLIWDDGSSHGGSTKMEDGSMMRQQMILLLGVFLRE